MHIYLHIYSRIFE